MDYSTIRMNDELQVMNISAKLNDFTETDKFFKTFFLFSLLTFMLKLFEPFRDILKFLMILFSLQLILDFWALRENRFYITGFSSGWYFAPWPVKTKMLRIHLIISWVSYFLLIDHQCEFYKTKRFPREFLFYIFLFV